MGVARPRILPQLFETDGVCFHALLVFQVACFSLNVQTANDSMVDAMFCIRESTWQFTLRIPLWILQMILPKSTLDNRWVLEVQVLISSWKTSASLGGRHSLSALPRHPVCQPSIWGERGAADSRERRSLHGIGRVVSWFRGLVSLRFSSKKDQ